MDDEQAVAIFSDAVNIVVNKYKNGGRLYIAGNGGSAADAQHLAAEFVSKLSKERSPLPAEALTVDTSVITAIGNDYGYDLIFSRQLKGKATARDIFFGNFNIRKLIKYIKGFRAVSDYGYSKHTILWP